MRIVASAVVGGTASAVTGGKFGNGAISGAFSSGFNDEAHHQYEQKSPLERFKSWMAEHTTELNLSVDVTVMWEQKGGQIGFALGIGDDGISFTGFATELTHDINSVTGGSYFLGASGAVGGSVTDYVESDFLNGSTGSNNVYAAGGGLIRSFGISTANNSNGLSLGVAKYGPGVGLFFADGQQHYATGRINW